MKAGALKSRPLLAAVSAIFAIRHDESRPCPSRTKQTGKKPRDNSTRLSWYLMPGSVLLSHGETPHYHRRYGDSGAEIPPLSCNHRLPCGIWHAESLVRWCERSILDANGHVKSSQPNCPWVSPTGGARLSGKTANSRVWAFCPRWLSSFFAASIRAVARRHRLLGEAKTSSVSVRPVPGHMWHQLQRACVPHS